MPRLLCSGLYVLLRRVRSLRSVLVVPNIDIDTTLTMIQVIVCIPEVPGFSGDVKSEGSLKIIMAAQYRTMNRGGSSIYEEIRNKGYEP